MLRLRSSFGSVIAYSRKHWKYRCFSKKSEFEEVTDDTFEKEVLNEKDKPVIVDFYAKLI
jgi:thioredoxin-like negative regulator of GroEL